MTTDGFARALGYLAAGLFGMALLQFIPVLGWITNLAIVLFGLGALVRGVAGRQ